MKIFPPKSLFTLCLDVNAALCLFVRDEHGWWKCHQCGFIFKKPTPRPPKRMCVSPPPPPEPRDPDDVTYILETLCPECNHYHWPDKTCRCKCSKGTPVPVMVKRGSCPAYRW